MPEAIPPVVRRRVELDTSADELWRLLADDAELGAWLGGAVELEIAAGSNGRFVDGEGVVRRIAVDTVEAGRQIGFTWWVDGDESLASHVSFTVEEGEGVLALVVEERPAVRAGGRACMASVAGDPWADRLLGLELAVLSRGLLVLS